MNAGYVSLWRQTGASLNCHISVLRSDFDVNTIVPFENCASVCSALLEKLRSVGSNGSISIIFKPDGEVYFSDYDVKLVKIHSYLEKVVAMFNPCSGGMVKVCFILPRYVCTDLSVPAVQKSKRKAGKMAAITAYPQFLRPYVQRSLGLIMLLCAWDMNKAKTTKAFVTLGSKAIVDHAVDSVTSLFNHIKTHIRSLWRYLVPERMPFYRHLSFCGCPEVSNFYEAITDISMS